MHKNLPSLAGVFSMAVALLAHDDFSFFVADSEFTSALRLVVKPNEVSGHLITPQWANVPRSSSSEKLSPHCCLLSSNKPRHNHVTEIV
jgi:hypothetical protein